MAKQIILIVDDKPELRELIRMSLDFGDFELHEADNGQRSLVLAKQIQPDLVILDVMMPGDIDGFQVCEQLKKDSSIKSPYVMMLTAKGQKADLEQGYRNGADSYLIKPFSPENLIERVRNALA